MATEISDLPTFFGERPPGEAYGRVHAAAHGLAFAVIQNVPEGEAREATLDILRVAVREADAEIQRRQLTPE